MRPAHRIELPKPMAEPLSAEDREGIGSIYVRISQYMRVLPWPDRPAGVSLPRLPVSTETL